jgi:hypothetical protein
MTWTTGKQADSTRNDWMTRAHQGLELRSEGVGDLSALLVVDKTCSFTGRTYCACHNRPLAAFRSSLGKIS